MSQRYQKVNRFVTGTLAGTLVAGACLILAITALNVLDRPGLSKQVPSTAPGD